MFQNVCLTFDKRTLELVNFYASSRSISRSAAVRMIIHEHLKQASGEERK